MRGKDALGLALLAGLLLIHFSALLGTGGTYFLGDLTYYNHPWRILPAEMLQRGMPPLWDPYSYLGMPLLARFQTGTFAPGNLPYLFFPFPAAYKFHLLLHHALAGIFTYLWLRRGGRWGALAGAASFSLCGYLAARVGQIMVAGTLVWWPAFFLFAGRPILLGLALACSLLAGHPPIWAAMAGSAAILSCIWGERDAWKSWLAAGSLAAGLSACVLAPGVELIANSGRGGAVSLEERTEFSVKPRELIGILSPAFIGERDPAGAKYPLAKTFYLGLGASGLALLGFLSARRKGLIAAYFAVAAVFLMGRESFLSVWAWSHLAPLRFIRFPSNFSFLLMAPLLPLIALGLKKRRWAPFAFLLVAVELIFYGRNIQPTMPNDYFSGRGPLVEWLGSALAGERYALSPRAAHALEGRGATAGERYRDVKRRLYGAANIPFHLPGATGIGESLIPSANYAVLDHVFSRAGAREAARLLPFLGVKYLLTPEAAPRGVGIARKEILWHAVELAGPARARWLPDSQSALLARGVEAAAALAGAAPLSYHEPREDRFTVSGEAPAAGWALVANPFYPGWEAWLGGRQVGRAPALGAFQRVRVGPGPFRLDFIYRPVTFRMGAWMTVLCLVILAAIGLRRGLSAETAGR